MLQGFLISILHFSILLLVTYFVVQKKIACNFKNVTAFGAGFLSVLVVFEFLPHALESHHHLLTSILLICLGFVVNALFEIMVLPRLGFLHRLVPEKEHHHHPHEHAHHHVLPFSTGCSVMGCFILCAFFDGIRLNSSILISPQTTLLVSLGLLLHLLPESIMVVGIGWSSGLSHKALMGVAALFCLSFLLGSVSFLFLNNWHAMEHVILAFASGLFLYMCLVHLIPVAITLKRKVWLLVGAVTSLGIVYLLH